MNTPTVLIADHDPEVINYIETALLCDGYRVITAQDGVEAVQLVQENKNGLAAAIVDVMLPNKNGIDTVSEFRKLKPTLPVVMTSGTAEPSRIVEAVKAGADDYVTKPIIHERLLAILRKLAPVEKKDRPENNGEVLESGFFYSDDRMSQIQRSLKKVANWNVPVILRGETGVGKEVVAREIHELSPRAKKPLMKINCVALPSELLESELFGFEKGAFTGAFRTKPGKFEAADGGTVLLDEIGDMDLSLQAKLLQFLQDGEFHRLGGKDLVRVDVRVLVATHRDLESAIEVGSFREDLYHRLNVVTIAIPPLCERRQEILPLARLFLKKHKQPNTESPELPPVLKRALVAYEWPGNVRELENVMRRFLVFGNGQELAAQLESANRLRNGRSSVKAAGNDHETESLKRSTSVEAEESSPSGVFGSPEDADLMGSGPLRSVNGHMQRDPGGTDSELFRRQDPDQSSRKISPQPENLEPDRTDLQREWPTQHLDSTLCSRLDELELLLRKLLIKEDAENTPTQGAPLPDDAGSSDHRPGDVASSGPETPTNEEEEAQTLEKLEEKARNTERQAILQVLERTQWNRKKAAAVLKVDYKGLLYRMKKLGIGANTTAN